MINVIDQYRPARVTVTGSWSSEEINYFSGNGTHVIPNTEYIIIVTAISDTRSSYPSDPVVVSKFTLMLVCIYVCLAYILIHYGIYVQHTYLP